MASNVIQHLSEPSLRTGYARNAAESANPGLWKGMVGAWVPALDNQIALRNQASGVQAIPGTSLTVSDKTRVDGVACINYDETTEHCLKIPNVWNLNPIGGLTVLQRINFDAIVNYQIGFNQDGTTSSFNSGKSVSTNLYSYINGDVLGPHDGVTGTWYSVCTAIEKGFGSRPIQFWVDGIAGPEVNRNPSSSNADFRIGADETTDSWCMNGKIAETYLWNRALTPTEIRQLSSDPLAPFRLRPTVISLPAVAPPVTTTTAISIPRLSEPSLKTGYARNAAESANPGLWKDVAGMWVPMLGHTGDTLHDVAGHWNGTLESIVAPQGWVTSEMGPVIRTGAANDHIMTALYLPGTGPLSFSFWFKTTSTVGQYLSMVGSVVSYQGFSIDIPSGKIVARFFTGTSTAGSTDEFNDQQWHHVTIIKPESGTPADVKIFADGIERAMTPSGSTVINVGSVHPVRLANNQNLSSSRFIGDIASCMAHRRELSDFEIRLLYQDPLAPFRLRNLVIPVPSGVAPPAARRRILISMS